MYVVAKRSEENERISEGERKVSRVFYGRTFPKLVYCGGVKREERNGGKARVDVKIASVFARIEISVSTSDTIYLHKTDIRF